MKCCFELSEELRQTPFLLRVHKVRKGFFLGKKKKMALHIIFSASCFVFFTLLLIECIQMKNSVLFTYVRQKKTIDIKNPDYVLVSVPKSTTSSQLVSPTVVAVFVVSM